MSIKAATVTVTRLQAPHQAEPFTQFKPLSPALKEEVLAAVTGIFDAAGGKDLLKSSGDVYLKPNVINSRPSSYPRPELIEAVIQYWKTAGARHIYLMENCTQSNFTRMVFALTGYSDICRRYGVREVFLDEEKSVPLVFGGKAPETQDETGYAQTNFRIPGFITRNLIERAEENLYISLPKLKTHSMSGVTLGIKNQWAFPQPGDRRSDHNYNLPSKLVDVLSYIQPDFTIIEGIEAVIHGHYPATALADKCVLPFRVLIGSANVVAADLVGARLFGLTPEKDALHLKIAIDRGYSRGVHSLDDVEIIGDISDFTQRYSWDLYPQFPQDITILKGTERCCREGCRNNPLTLMQILSCDFQGKGGWTIVMGKGHDPAAIDAVKRRVLVAGHCAIDEAGGRLAARLGRKNVYFSGYCNDLCATTNALCHLMQVNPLLMAPLPFFKSLKLLALSKLHISQAKIPFFFAHKIKVV
jgi:uncharacterized protein (DUF362 family)